MRVDPDGAAAEATTYDELLEPMLARLPSELIRERDDLRRRLEQARETSAVVNVRPVPVEPTAA